MVSFINADIFDTSAELLVIPISTEGTISESFSYKLRNLELDKVVVGKLYKLGDLELCNVQSGSLYLKYLAFVCTVEDFKSAYFSIRMIGQRLAKAVETIDEITEIATPILGSGAGKLEPGKSINILRNAFYEKGDSNVKLTFFIPDKNVYSGSQGQLLDTNTPSAQLAIQAEMPRIMNANVLQDLQYDSEFFYVLAQIKFDEYLSYKNDEENFYLDLERLFKNSKLTFREFLNYNNLSKQQYVFLVLCGQLVAYVDYNAYKKNIWNDYPDKRVLARASVRQDDWIINLIKYKRTDDLHTLSSSIKNVFFYFGNPSQNLTMLSERHRKLVVEELFLENYEGIRSTKLIIDFFKRLGLETRNNKNFGAFCSRILYHPFIKPLWTGEVSNSDRDVIVNDELEGVDIYQASRLIEECLRKRLKSLDIGNCGLKNLSVIPELFECYHLEELILSNEWSFYENGKWRRITSANKGIPNNISFLPDGFKKLVKLKRLICGGDWNSQRSVWNRWGITSIANITMLNKLEYLNVSNNRLQNVKGISKLYHLKVLHLNNNELTTVESLADLIDLEEIYISNNFIKNVSFLQKLPAVITIDLHNNDIRDLTPLATTIEKIGIINGKWKTGKLNVAQNPLEQPPMEIVNIGTTAVLRTFQDVKERGRYVNNEIKVVLVGNSEVGKSTLVKYLDGGDNLDQPHPFTMWMEIKTIKSKYKIDILNTDCILHLFDFGGHDYYHDTHHLFFSSNTVYLLLWEDLTNKLNLRTTIQKNATGEDIQVVTQDYPIKYWLESIKYYTKDIGTDNFEFEIERKETYSSSLLLIQNKVAVVSQISHQNNNQLCEQFPFIYDLLNLSVKSPQRNMAHFDEAFKEMLNSMKIIGATLPSFYETIKGSFSNYRGNPVLSIDAFLNYCNQIITQPIDIDQCHILVRYLAQIGVVLLSNNSNDPKVYVDKTWIVTNIHKVLGGLNSLKGEFNEEYLIKTLELSADDAYSVLQMMLDFRIVFKHPYETLYIAPLYLPNMPEAKISMFINDDILPHRRFQYDGFIQKNVILSVFQKYSKLLSTEEHKENEHTFYYWKDGLVIKKPGTTEIVMIKFYLGNNEGAAYIDVFDIGRKVINPSFINEVVQYIKEVNKGYDLDEMVTINGIDFISVDVLEKNAKHGKLVFSEKRLSDINIPKEKEKFFNLKDYSMFIKEEVKKKKVVISYSKKDLADVHTLIRYLQPIVAAGLIEEPWYCTNLLPGDDWNLKIGHKFKEADIIFFLVSEYFYSTKYIVEHEITTAINRYDSGDKVKIVPVILQFYDWGRPNPYNLQRFSALPYQAKPISDFKNPKIAWSTITASVRMMIEKDLDPYMVELINRDLQEIYERQVKGMLDSNSI